MITISIKNQKVSFQQAIDKQFAILKIMEKHGIITHIRTKKNKYIEISEISKDYLKKVLAKKIKIDLEDPNDLNSSRIGYNLWLPIRCFGKSGGLSIRFGTPKISGKDNISLREPNTLLSENYNEMVLKYHKMLIELIPLVNPIKVLCFDYYLRNILDDNEFEYGFIIYNKGNKLKRLANNKNIKLEKLKNGYIWKSDFSSYENGIASVVKAWSTTS